MDDTLSGRSKKEYAKEAQAVADAPDAASATTGASAADDLEPWSPMGIVERRGSPTAPSPGHHPVSRRDDRAAPRSTQLRR